MVKILKFYSSNCAPCSLLEKELVDFDNVESLNIADQFDKAMTYGVRKAPTVVVLKDDKEIGRFVGFKTKQEITSYLESL